MIASARTTHSHSWLSRLIVSLTVGLMMLALGASAAFAATGIQATHVAGNAAPVISSDGGQVNLDEDDDDDDEDDEDEEGGGGGGGLPATDTAPLVTTHVAGNAAPVISADGGQPNLDEDDDDDEDDEDEDGGGGGRLPATDTASVASTAGESLLLPGLTLLVIAGLAGGAVTVASKRPVRS